MKPIKKAGHNAYFANGFEAGVVFAQEQFKILNKVCQNCEHDKSFIDEIGQERCKYCGDLW